MKKKYSEKDFKIEKGYPGDNVAYTFTSKDDEIEANLFWRKGDVEVRGMVGEKGILHIGYPFANAHGDKSPEPELQRILSSIIKRVNRGEY